MREPTKAEVLCLLRAESSRTAVLITDFQRAGVAPKTVQQCAAAKWLKRAASEPGYHLTAAGQEQLDAIGLPDKLDANFDGKKAR